jgi:hypothetical protein
MEKLHEADLLMESQMVKSFLALKMVGQGRRYGKTEKK